MTDYTKNTPDLIITAVAGMAKAMSRNLYNPIALVNWETGEFYYASDRILKYLRRNSERRNALKGRRDVQSLLASAQNTWKSRVLPYVISAEDMMENHGWQFCDFEYLALEIEGISESHRRVFYWRNRQTLWRGCADIIPQNGCQTIHDSKTYITFAL